MFRLAGVWPAPSSSPPPPPPEPPIGKIRKLLRLAREAEASGDAALRCEGESARCRAEQLMAKWGVEVWVEDESRESLGVRDAVYAQLAFECAASRGCRAGKDNHRGVLLVTGPRQAAREAAWTFWTALWVGRAALAESGPQARLRSFQEEFWRSLAGALANALPRSPSVWGAGGSSSRRASREDSLRAERERLERAIKTVAKALEYGKVEIAHIDALPWDAAISVLEYAVSLGVGLGGVVARAVAERALPDFRIRRPRLALPPSSISESARRFAGLDIED